MPNHLSAKTQAIRTEKRLIKSLREARTVHRREIRSINRGIGRAKDVMSILNGEWQNVPLPFPKDPEPVRGSEPSLEGWLGFGEVDRVRRTI